jgi:Tfp pilus assembly protein PilF
MIQQPDNLPDDQIEVWQQAVEYFQRAYRMQMQGDVASAIRDYKLSIYLYPTPEAHTYLGWVYSFLHLYDLAIAACRQAIDLDPDYGNPYNDIGAYLIELERPADAIPWLERACAAPRYDARIYAFFNLGRACELLGDWSRALEHYRAGLRHAPEYRPARYAVERLLGKLN